MFVQFAAKGLKHGHERRDRGRRLSKLVFAAWVLIACHLGFGVGRGVK